MAVIIDDFEVVVQPPGDQPEAVAAPNPQQPQRAALEADDVCTIVRQAHERSARLHAH